MKWIIRLTSKGDVTKKIFQWGLLGSNRWVFFHTICGGVLTLGFLVGLWWWLFSSLIRLISFNQILIYQYFEWSKLWYWAGLQTFVITILWEIYENYKETPTDDKKSDIYGSVEKYLYDQIGDVIAANLCSVLVLLGFLLGTRT